MDSIDRPHSASHDGEAKESRRSRDRDSLFLMGRLLLSGEPTSQEVRIRNLSEGGLMAEFERPITIGTTLTLTLRGIGDVPGRVAWCAEGRIGIALDYPIDPRRARKSVGGGEHTPIYAKPWLG